MKPKLRKMMFKVLSASVLFTLVFSLTVAVAPTEKAFALSYDFTNPISTGCANTAVTEDSKYIYNKSGTKLGYIQLRFSTKCQTAWGYLKLYSPAPSDNYGSAGIYGYNSSGLRILAFCDSTGGSKGGNGNIMKGQTSCFTGQVYDGAGNYAFAAGFVGSYSSQTGYY
ncbi:DUF2690 domain-containing protein [Paenibacillus humicola]|uniref:DUF2690 domain-containing protein n=1 Tax=Paenibacillus humicola TaxID=3110540 RepID=UPI00237AA319|nr:DUF2690 domain-containing protein [Paenibacillus humicola]